MLPIKLATLNLVKQRPEKEKRISFFKQHFLNSTGLLETLKKVFSYFKFCGSKCYQSSYWIKENYFQYFYSKFKWQFGLILKIFLYNCKVNKAILL